MNRIKLFVITLLAIAPLCLIAQNNMPLLTMMEGEFPGAALGHSICSMDFNGDGLKDLVALEKHWNPNDTLHMSQQFGRIRFYWGGTAFDNEADYDINGTYHLQYGMGFLCNAGDLNNDGYEDLCYWGRETQQRTIFIFYGRQVPVATPDYTMLFPSSDVDQIGFLDPLGDINNDGHDDIGYVLDCRIYPHAIVRVLDGATMTTIDLYNTIWASPGCSIRGIGDVNNDGIDDFHVQLPLSLTDNTHSLLSVHFGSSNFPVTDSLLISADTNSLIVPTGCPLGDVNGDGIDDFASFINNDGVKVWYGSPNLTAEWDLAFTSMSSGGYVWGPYIAGDFNNDGYNDIVTSDYGYALFDGRAYLWMGRTNLNGTVDLVFRAPPGVGEQFGWAMATGDFNCDGFCDLAISQPWSYSGILSSSGKIFVYQGNAQLEDTTVANEDPVLPGIGDQLTLRVSPNPVTRADQALSVIIKGAVPNGTEAVSIEIFNIKGQLVYKEIHEHHSGDGKYKVKTPSLSTGIYLCKVSSGKQTAITKFSVIK